MGEEFEATVRNVDLKKVKDNPFREKSAIAVKEKPAEQFRQDIVDGIFRAITKETTSSTDFEQRGDLFNAKLSEARIEGLHKALGIVLEASTINVKE